MTALIILGVLAAIITLICLIPIGADLGYEGKELHVSAKAAGILIPIIPRPKRDKPKEEKPKKAKKQKKPKDGPAEPKPKKEKKLNFSKEEILELVRAVLKGIGRFGRAWKVDRFVLRYVAAGGDPYETARIYGFVNAALSSLAPLCRRRFKVRDCEVWTDIDFTAEEMSLDLGLAMTIRIGQILGVGLSIAFAGLGILLRNKRRLKREARALKKAQGSQPVEDSIQNTENTDSTEAEERTEANG